MTSTTQTPQAMQPTRARRTVAARILVLAAAVAGAFTAGGPSAYAQAPPTSGKPVCGTPVLHSPYGYAGAPGPYASGTAGLPTYGTPGSDFPDASAGEVLPAGKRDYASYELRPHTVYYLLPGVHKSIIQADAGDAFVGGRAGRRVSVLSGAYKDPIAIDSNYSAGDQPGVTIEYLTIEKYKPGENAVAINQTTNSDWTVRRNTIRLNVPGAGMFAGSGNVISENCLTENGQYGLSSFNTSGFGTDALTGGPYGITISDNEISRNDTCDFSGLLNNAAIGWHEYDPVPVRYRNKHCPPVIPDGDQGGFKLWATNGVTVRGNFIHDNWGPGAWVDTNNANTTFDGNYFAANEGPAIIEEISYNFAITDNTIVGNGINDGLDNPGFPQPAIYISASGSDTTFGGVAGCSEAACSGQGAYPHQSVIDGNVLTDNAGGVFLWQSESRSCGAGFDGDACTLVDGGSQGPFNASSCAANYASASIDTATYVGNRSGSPEEDWWDGCIWKTENVSVTHNTTNFHPGNVMDCNPTAWPDCGATGMFAVYGDSPPYDMPGSWIIPDSLAFHQGNTFSENTYNGPTQFFAWNQGNRVSAESWTGPLSGGDQCSSAEERKSGLCDGPFGQDAGSTLNP